MAGLLWRSAAAGVVLVAATLLFSWALSAPTPFELVANPLTLLLPGAVLSKLIGLLHYWAKPLLLVALALAWLVIGGLVAVSTSVVLNRQGPRAPRGHEIFIVSLAACAVWLFSGLALGPGSGAGVFAAHTSAGPMRFALATALANGAFGLALVLAFSSATPDRMPTERQVETPSDSAPGPLERPGAGIARRDFMLLSGSAVMGVVGGAVLANRVTGLLANAKGAGLASGAPPLPYDASVVRGDLEVTPAENFYVISKNFGDPDIETATWRLKIEGDVEKPLVFTLSDLKALPSIEQHVTLECIGNDVGGEVISSGLWTGLPLADVLKLASPRKTAAWVLTYAEDGYTESLHMSDATQPQVMLAWDLNGQPLSYKHGKPLRLLVPGRFRQKSTKWLTKIELAGADVQGYWEERGYNEECIVRTMSKINHPRPGFPFARGKDISVRGIAFAGMRGISRVEVSVDGQQTWQPAELKPRLSPYTWTLWTWTWKDPAPGLQHIAVRAVDGNGTAQEVGVPDPFPDGAAGYDVVEIRVV